MRDNLTKYIQKSATGQKEDQRVMYNKLPFMVKDPLPENISLANIIKTIESYVPEKFTVGIDMVFVGQFEDVVERDATSLWADGAIFVDNEQDNDDDIIEDIIHEIAHAVEDSYMLEVYGDDSIENEFLLKRRHLYDILESQGLADNIQPFLSLQYDLEFDKYLYKTIGYERLTWLTMGLFVSPYGATSLKEYFANGFEEYFTPTGDRGNLKAISPALYQKIQQLMDI